MTLGSAFHYGVAHNYRQKAQSHQDLPVDDVLDAFTTNFDWRKDETEWGDDDPGEFKDRGVVTLKEYQKVIAPQTQPLDVEQEFVMRFSNADYTFRGIADVITESAIVETKTTSRRVSAPKHDHLIQTWAYSTGIGAQRQQDMKAHIDYAVSKQEPEMISFDLDVSDADRQFFLSVMARVARGIEAEIWIPNRNGNLCSKKWCGFAEHCVKLAGGTVRD
jgi:hypothetical protein